MKVYKIFKFIILILFIGQFHHHFASDTSKLKKDFSCHNDKVILLKQELKRLVSINVFWARLYIISTLADLPDKKAIKERLLKNQQSFGSIINLFYGKNASNKLTKLLREHKNITVNLIKAIKNNNENQIKIVEINWYQNIKDIVIFLNKLNPKLPVDYLFKLFSGLLRLTKQEITLRANERWEEDIKNFDKILNYALYLADNLADKIINK